MLLRKVRGIASSGTRGVVHVMLEITSSLPFQVLLPRGADHDKLLHALGHWSEYAEQSSHPWIHQRLVYKISPETRYDTGLDLAVIAATVGASDRRLYIGEVNIDGSLAALDNPIDIGLLSVKSKLPIVVPYQSAALVAMSGAETYGISHIGEVVEPVRYKIPKMSVSGQFSPFDDFYHIKGQEEAKRAMEIAIAGGHNLLFVGPPGEGKSALAQRAYTIAPPMDLESILECTNLWQLAGRIPGDEVITQRPFIAASLDTTPTSMLGGGDELVGPRPGLVSLAHNGILLCDELFEWSSRRVESLRIPLQDRRVTISRRDFQVTLPASFQLVATANPCPCGYYGHPTIPCRCSYNKIEKYQSRFSGPIADRIDLKVVMKPLGDKIFSNKTGEKSEKIRKRVTEAQHRQESRLSKYNISRNAEITPGIIDKVVPIGASVLKNHISTLSSRGVDMARKISRTIADLEDTAKVKPEHIEEAISLMEWRTKLI